MSKVTISDFFIALLDLVEAESRALQDSASKFVAQQQGTLRKTLYQGGWMVAWIAAAVVALLGGLGLLVWALFRLLSAVMPETGAILIIGAFLLAVAVVFARLAMRMKR